MIIGMRKGLAAASVRRRQGKRGFTLTEVAIVLGIIGLILGAIWVAAAAVYNNLRVSKATTELLTITQNVRAMYATSSIVDAGADMSVSGVQAGGALTYIQAGIFPSDMVNGGNTIQSPWGGGAAVVSAKFLVASDSFAVEFDKVPQSACITLLTSNTGQGRDSGLYTAAAGAAGALIITAGSALANTAFPMPASTAQGLCPAAGANVGFGFKLKG